MSKPSVGVIGSGTVGKVLAAGFSKHGHRVTLGSRSPPGVAAWAETAAVTAGTFAEAATADIVVLAVVGAGALEALDLAGPERLAGKVVVDATNPIADGPPINGVLQYFTGPNDALMQRLQAHVPAARFVKAFNSVGNAFMVNPNFPGGRPTMFICGDDPAAKSVVTSLLDTFGWDAEDVGGVEAAGPVEALCQLWCAPGMLRGDWAHAFKVIRPG